MRHNAGHSNEYLNNRLLRIAKVHVTLTIRYPTLFTNRMHLIGRIVLDHEYSCDFYHFFLFQFFFEVLVSKCYPPKFQLPPSLILKVLMILR